MFKVGLGQAEGYDTAEVVRRVIESCAAQMGDVQAQAGIVFAGPHFDHKLMLHQITGAFPGIQLVGCTSSGDFSSTGMISEDSITMTVFASDVIEFGAGVSTGIAGDLERAVCDAVSDAKKHISGPPSFCLTFPAWSHARIEEALGSCPMSFGLDCPVFGGIAGTLMSEESMASAQFFGDEVFSDAIPVLLMSGPVRYSFSIAKSWRPIGEKAVVTSSTDRHVERIGDMTAVEFYRHYIGYHEIPVMDFMLAVHEPGTEEFFICAPLEYHDDGAITFTGAIEPGSQIQLTEAVRDDLIEDTRRSSKSLVESAKDWQPVVGLTFSCGFRKNVLGTAVSEELATIKEQFPQNLPMIGFYSFGEIAPLIRDGGSKILGATLVMLLLGVDSEDAEQETLQPVKAEQVPEPMPEESKILLKRKLKRAEYHRKRLESIKDYTSQMHRQMMAEVHQARSEILEKKKALRKSEEKFRRIVHTAGEGFILMDESQTIIDINEAFCRLIGYSANEMIGSSCLDFASEEFRSYIQSHSEQLLSQEYRKFEGTVIARDGREIPILIHGNSLRGDNGELLGHMAFITDMTEQKKALALAGEVQRSLLPRDNPKVSGLDIAGRNLSCEEVGGDYYDFFLQQEQEGSGNSFSVAVGDITGHGVDAALLMSSARAFLRMHVSRDESITDIVEGMNRYLVEDVVDSGRFMTLFYLNVKSDLRSLEWIRAGHDPAILYDPTTDEVEYLKGPGMAMGVDCDYAYIPTTRSGLRDGSVVAIGTDGIWDSRNMEGEMYGRERFVALLKENSHLPSSEILNRTFTSLEEFRNGRKADDDITLVIIKVNNSELGQG